MKTGMMKAAQPAAILRALWKVSISPVTFVVLSLLWCLDLAAGSITAYYADPNFSARMDAYPFKVWLGQVAPRTLPHSLWVYILVALSYLLVLSLLFCTVNWFLKRRYRLRGLGEVLVHLGFLLIFSGFVLGSTFGVREQRIMLAPGETKELPFLDMALRLDGMRVVTNDRGRPVDTVSEVALLQGEREAAAGEVRINHPLIWGSTVVYPRDRAGRPDGAVLRLGKERMVRVRPGGHVDLGDGRRILVQALLGEGERRGSLTGPGVLLALRDSRGRHGGAAFLSNRPGTRQGAVLDGMPVRFVSFTAAEVAVFDVHRDPGIWFAIIGAVVLACGTLWALAGYLGMIPSAAGADGA